MDPGERIGHYRLVELVGSGGMGEVYRAVDERLRREVAVKVLPQADARVAERQARLLREAQAASHLNHPNIVTVHDVGVWQERTYIVMELVEGRALGELARGELPVREAIALCRQAAEAMGLAHGRGILHRDIKPDNLMVTADGRLKILDFGVAKLLETGEESSVTLDPVTPPRAGGGPDSGRNAAREESTNTAPAAPPATISGRRGDDDTDPAIGEGSDPALAATILTPSPGPAPAAATPVTADLSATRAGALIGTPAYMSPEQAMGASIDERSEVYSLGLVLHELLTGVRPLGRDTLEDTIAAARDPHIPPPSASAPSRRLPRACDRVVARALARDPEDRYPDMAAFAAALRELERALEPRRARWLVPSAGAAALAGGLGLAAYLVLGPSGAEPRAPAVAPATTAAPAAEARPRVVVEEVRRLTFDPGCEELPAFSSDGRWVLFDAVVDGDTEVVRLDLDDGRRQRLTTRPGWDMAAAPSPDGRFILFIRYTETGRELAVMPYADGAPGAPRTLAQARGLPSWTRDGRIVFGDDEGRVLLIDPRQDPARPVEVTAARRGYLYTRIAPLADGRLLFGARFSGRDSSNLQIGLIHPDERFELLERQSRALETASFTVDAAGRGFYFGEATSVGLRAYWQPLGAPGASPDGPPPPEELPPLPFPHGGMTVAPAGDRMILSTCRQVHQLGRMGRDHSFTPLVRPGDWSDTGPQLLPDGRILFASDRTGAIHIWALDPTGEPRMVIDRPSSFPALSPDRTRLAWIGLGSEAAGVYVSAPDGSDRRRLTRSTRDDRASFSRRGDGIYFLRGSEDGCRVFEVPLAGGEPRPVTPANAIGYAASPTADRIAWLARRGEGREIMIGPPGGPFTRFPRSPIGNFSSPSFSRDGATLWVVRGGSELLELDVAGRRPPRVVWRTRNDFIAEVVPDADGEGWIGGVARFEGDLYLATGTFP